MTLKDQRILDHVQERAAASLIIGRARLIEPKLSRQTNKKNAGTKDSAA